MTETGYAKESVAFCEQSTQRSVLIKKRLPGAKFHEGPVEGLLNIGSINFSRKAESWFPFDVINIDICGSPFSQNSQFTACIEKLFIAQKLKRQSFTLYITSCSAEDGDIEPNKEMLRTMVRSNFSVNAFKRVYEEKYPQPRLQPKNKH